MTTIKEVTKRVENWINWETGDAEPYRGSRTSLFEDLRFLLQCSGLQPIATAPKDGRYILLFGPSGYSCETPLRCEVCHWDEEYRALHPWKKYNGGSFLDSGDPPTHWMPLP